MHGQQIQTFEDGLIHKVLRSYCIGLVKCIHHVNFQIHMENTRSVQEAMHSSHCIYEVSLHPSTLRYCFGLAITTNSGGRYRSPNLQRSPSRTYPPVRSSQSDHRNNRMAQVPKRRDQPRDLRGIICTTKVPPEFPRCSLDTIGKLCRGRQGAYSCMD